MVPLIEKLSQIKPQIQRSDGAYMFIICPVRELCIQCHDIARQLLSKQVWIVPGLLVGGENPQKEKSRLRKGVNILCATPGRLLYHLQNTSSFKFDRLACVVFEECDRILDMGFKKDLDQILELLLKKVHFENVQKILISANFTEKIQSLYLKMSSRDIKYIGFQNRKEIEEGCLKIDDTYKIPQNLKQQFVLLQEEQRLAFLLAYLRFLKSAKVIIFVATCDEVEYFSYLLDNLKFRNQNGEQTEDRYITSAVFKLHGNIDQKIRSETYFQFKAIPSDALLISTDVASRGLDFDDVTHTVIFDIPTNIPEYINRIGRTARIDKEGESLLVLNTVEKPYIDKLRKYKIDMQLFEEEQVFQATQDDLRQKYQIGTSIVQYILSMVRALIKDKPHHQMARRAFVSSTRAYARLQDKKIFLLKKLNLGGLSKSFGLAHAKASKETTSDQY